MQRGSSLWETLVLVMILLILGSIVAPVTAQLIQHGQQLNHDPGPRLQALAWELRLAAAQAWRIHDQQLLIMGARWHNHPQGIAKDGVLTVHQGHLQWQRDEYGNLLITIGHHNRPEWQILAPHTAEEQP